MAEGLLKTLFIVSDAALTDEGSLGTSAPEWAHVTSLSIPGACRGRSRLRPR
jgi:isoleucyl-tRNA synthetase